MSEENNNSGEGEAVKNTEDQESVGTATVQEPTNNSEDFEALKNQYSTLEERLQQQSALIGKLNNSLKRFEKEEPEIKPESVEKDTEKGEIQEYNELKQQLNDFQNRMKKQEKAAKLGAIELALVEAGASPTLAKQQSDFFMFKLGDRIESSDDESGKIDVTIKDTDGSTAPLSAWANALLQSDTGAYLRATKRGPSVKNDGESVSHGSKVKLSMSEFTKGIAEASQQGEEAIKAFRSSHSLES